MRGLLEKYKIYSYLIPLMLMVFIPLYFKFPLFSFSETFVSIRLEDILIFLALGMTFIYLLATKEIPKLLKDKLILALLVFFFIGFVSLFSAAFLTQTVSFKIGFFHYLRRIEYLLLMPLGYLTIKSLKQIKICLAGMFLVVLVVNVYAIGQKYFNFPVVSTINSELSKGLIYYLGQFDRINSTFSGHYDLAVFSVMVISFISAFIFYYLEEKKWKQVAVCIFSFLFSFAVLIMTAARLSFVAGVAGIFFSLFLLRKGKYILIALVLLLSLCLYPSQLRDRFMATITVNILQSWDKYAAVSKEQEERSKLNISTLPATGKRIDTVGADAADITPGEPIDTTGLGVYRSLEIRTQVEWPRALRALRKNPLLGTGYSSLGLATDNDILRSLGEVGILGTFAFILIFFEMLKRLWKQYTKSKGFVKYVTAGMLSLSTALLLNSLVIDVFEASKVASLFWLFTGLSLSLGKND